MIDLASEGVTYERWETPFEREQVWLLSVDYRSGITPPPPLPEEPEQGFTLRARLRGASGRAYIIHFRDPAGMNLGDDLDFSGWPRIAQDASWEKPVSSVRVRGTPWSRTRPLRTDAPCYNFCILTEKDCLEIDSRNATLFIEGDHQRPPSMPYDY